MKKVLNTNVFRGHLFVPGLKQAPNVPLTGPLYVTGHCQSRRPLLTASLQAIEVGLSQDAVDVVVRDAVLAQGGGWIFWLGKDSRAAGSLGNMKSSLVSGLNGGAGPYHLLWTADPTAVTAGRLSRKKEVETSWFERQRL